LEYFVVHLPIVGGGDAQESALHIPGLVFTGLPLEVAPMGPGLKVWCNRWADYCDLGPGALQFGDFILGDGAAAEYEALLAGQI
jgi:hypothetical protein